jgi:hypothetical protein
MLSVSLVVICHDFPLSVVHQPRLNLADLEPQPSPHSGVWHSFCDASSDPFGAKAKVFGKLGSSEPAFQFGVAGDASFGKVVNCR